MVAVQYTRVRHAAHYGYNHPAKGHDLERWEFVANDNVRPEGVPVDAEYHCGFLEGGVQRWVYVRVAPLSGTCPRCGGGK